MVLIFFEILGESDNGVYAQISDDNSSRVLLWIFLQLIKITLYINKQYFFSDLGFEYLTTMIQFFFTTEKKCGKKWKTNVN